MNGSTILAGIFAAAGLAVAAYAWAPRPDPGSAEAAQFPDKHPYEYRYDEMEVTPELRAAAEAGDPQAQFELAILLISEAGLNHAPPDAVDLLLKAAESGHPAAANEIGLAYRQRLFGLPRDPDAAFAWFKRAAVGGDELGQYNFAISYRDGEGSKRNDAESARYFLLAAQRGVPEAQYNLSLMLREGVGVERSPETSRRAKAAAARQGSGAAAFLQIELRTLNGVALDDASLPEDWRTNPFTRLWFGFAHSVSDPAQVIRCRAIFGDVSGILPHRADEEATSAEKQMALMRIAALLGDPYAQSALADYWKARPKDPTAADEEYYWRMRAAKNPLKLEIPADCGSLR